MAPPKNKLVTLNDVPEFRITDEQKLRARVTVARFAQDADDCRMLLDMLGLLPNDESDDLDDDSDTA